MASDTPRASEAFAVHVRRAVSGPWWTVDVHGEVFSQWPSEFSAIDAGRVNARRLVLPLIIHDDAGTHVEPAPSDFDD
jgi:hypothetical protein